MEHHLTDDDIFKQIIEFEGKTYTNHPADVGGPTKFGITIPAWQAFSGKAATAETIKALDLEDARAFYYAVHIRPFDALSDPLRLLVIDLSILRGVRTVIRMLQDLVDTTVDGWIGPKTLAAVESVDNVVLTNLLVGMRLYHIYQRIKDNPSQVIFRRNWRNRVLTFVQACE